ncbi:hypothetical protein K461DRAFT_266591 [Myriangium duriaei CBS 260.36]|uniref:Uncharacterized protein n=1 Tax=Myriangium duriaei CBS 260.36 TaxID=1168546 RepID=A0A9P4MJG9_9PEZI|nr:hypothetical protein K461DRAFT_266591 [Myriangium duriaei CBS 260.36]
MATKIHPWTFCIVTAIDKAAEDSLKLLHNAHVFIDERDEDETVSSTQGKPHTPTYGLGQQVLKQNQQRTLKSDGTNIIKVAGRVFQLEILDWKKKDNGAWFEERWPQFVKEVNYPGAEAKPEAEKEKTKATPWHSVDPEMGLPIRYLPTPKLISFEDLSVALGIPQSTFGTLAQKMSLRPAVVGATGNVQYLNLTDAKKLCDAYQKAPGAAQSLEQAIRTTRSYSSQNRNTFITHIQPSWVRTPAEQAESEANASIHVPMFEFVE